MDSFHTCYDPGRGVPLSCAVVEAVADASATEATQLPPLHDVVDPDALDALFQPRHTGDEPRDSGLVSFEYAGHRVRVGGNGDISVERLAADGTGMIADEETFRAELARLLRSAADNGVDIEGGWSCRDGIEPDLGIEIYEVE